MPFGNQTKIFIIHYGSRELGCALWSIQIDPRASCVRRLFHLSWGSYAQPDVHTLVRDHSQSKLQSFLTFSRRWKLGCSITIQACKHLENCQRTSGCHRMHCYWSRRAVFINCQRNNERFGIKPAVCWDVLWNFMSANIRQHLTQSKV